MADIKTMMAIIYLLAKSVSKNCEIWPNMIPVVSSDTNLKFVKRGTSRNK